MGGAFIAHEINRNCIQNIGRKTEGSIYFARPRRRWEDNIKMNLKQIRRESVDRIHLVQERFQWRDRTR
jgi:hypothetical protein